MRGNEKAALAAVTALAVVLTGALGAIVAISGPLMLRSAFAASSSTETDPTTAPPPPDSGPVPAERGPDRGTEEPGNIRPPGSVEPLADLAAYRDQTIDWQTCGGFQCAEVVTPLDWDLPGDDAITLSLRQRPATDGPKLGTIFVNPGGPGESGVALVEGFAAAGLERYDIVGWDPRGTGASTPVRCGSDADRDTLLDVDESPDDDAEFDALIQTWRDFNELCLRDSGKLLEHVSTVETAKDLDLLRELVGDTRLNYFGYSYGTIIGQTYIELFDDRLGRIALDSVAPMPIDDNGQRMSGTGGGQAAGFDASLNEFAEWCSQSPECVIEGSAAGVMDQITTLLDDLDSEPLPVGRRELTQSLAVTGLIRALYADDSQWPALSEVLRAAMAGQGSQLLALADSYNSRDPAGRYAPSSNAFYAINCLDSGDTGVEQARIDYENGNAAASGFGRYFGPSVACPTWSVPPSIPLQQTFPEAPPMLVIGVTGDPATPYAWSEGLASRQPGANLITLEGVGHTAYGRNPCVDEAVVDYFTTGEPPDGELRCS